MHPGLKIHYNHSIIFPHLPSVTCLCVWNHSRRGHGEGCGCGMLGVYPPDGIAGMSQAALWHSADLPWTLQYAILIFEEPSQALFFFFFCWLILSVFSAFYLWFCLCTFSDKNNVRKKSAQEIRHVHSFSGSLWHYFHDILSFKICTFIVTFFWHVSFIKKNTIVFIVRVFFSDKKAGFMAIGPL